MSLISGMPKSSPGEKREKETEAQEEAKNTEIARKSTQSSIGGVERTLGKSFPSKRTEGKKG